MQKWHVNSQLFHCYKVNEIHIGVWVTWLRLSLASLFLGVWLWPLPLGVATPTNQVVHGHGWTTPTQYVVNTALSVYLVCYFLVPHTHVLCMGSGSATGNKFQVRLVHSLLKFFFKFQLWYWIKNLHYQILKFVIDNSDISLNCLQHIQKRRNFDAKVTCHQPICLLLHAILILSGVGVGWTTYYSHLIVCIWGWYFLVPHTHVLCMGSGSATGFFPAARLVHSLPKYFFKFQLWYWIQVYTTPTQYVVNTLYWPHTALSVYLVCYFLVPHTHVLCMGSGSATGKKFQARLVHSLLKYFFKFQLWYWIKNLHYQIFKFVIDNSDISLNCLQHIQKSRNFDAKVTCHQPICLLLHAILSKWSRSGLHYRTKYSNLILIFWY